MARGLERRFAAVGLLDVSQNALSGTVPSELGLLGAIDYGGERQNPFGMGGAGMRDVPISEATAQQIDAETRRLLEGAWQQARTILNGHRGLLDRMAEHLLETEVLERETLQAFLSEVTHVGDFPGFPSPLPVDAAPAVEAVEDPPTDAGTVV